LSKAGNYMLPRILLGLGMLILIGGPHGNLAAGRCCPAGDTLVSDAKRFSWHWSKGGRWFAEPNYRWSSAGYGVAAVSGAERRNLGAWVDMCTYGVVDFTDRLRGDRDESKGGGSMDGFAGRVFATFRQVPTTTRMIEVAIS